MFKKEFYKLLINPIFKFSTIILFILVFVLCLYSGLNTKNENINIVNIEYIDEYYSIDDINRNLSKINSEIESLDKSSVNFKNEYENLNNQKSIYEYLLNNYIPYIKLAESSVLSNSITSNIFSFHAKLLAVIFLLVYIYILIINFIIFSSDFDYGSYKYLYNISNKNKILKTKFFITLILLLIIAILISIIISIYSYLSFKNVDYSLIGVLNNKVVYFNLLSFLLLDCLSFIINVVFYTIFLSGIFYNFKKSMYSLLFSILYFLLILMTNNFNNYLSSVFLMPIFSFYNQTLLFTLFYNVIISSLCLLIGIYRFKRCDLS